MQKSVKYRLKSTLYCSDKKLTDISFDYKPKCLPTVNHIHRKTEIHILTEGKKTFILNFERKYELKVGDILIIPPEVYHEEFPLSDNTSSHILSFFTEGDGNLFPMEEECLLVKDKDGVVEILNSIYDEIDRKKALYENIVEYLTATALLKTLRLYGADSEKQKDAPYAEVDFEYIDMYFNTVFGDEVFEYTPTELAKSLNVSVRQLNRILQKEYGMSFQEKLIHTKLKYVKYSLLHSDKTLTEIGEKCSWDVRCMIRYFKKEFGMTPSQFRKENGINCNKRTRF